MVAERQEEFVFYSDKLNYKTALGAKGKEYFVEGYISTGDLDLVNDIVTKSCMSSMLNQFDNRTIKMDFEHEAFRGANQIDSEAAKTRIPLGKAIIKSQDSKGVLVKWKMNPSWKKFDSKGDVVMTFKDIWTNVEEGMYDAFSIAYVPTRTKSIDREGKSVRLLDDVNLLNVALTGNAINPQATMTAVMAKSLEFMKSKEGEGVNMDTIEIKNKKEKKSYKEDGKHIHTPEGPMGEHNHPEIEEEISRLWERCYELRDDIYKATSKTIEEESSITGIKSKKSHLSGQVADKEIMGCKPMVDKKNEVPEDDAQTPPTPEGEGSNASEAGNEEAAVETQVEGGEPEGKSMTLTELKSVVETLLTDVNALKKENADLKAIVEKPLQKARGAEQKSQGNEQPNMVGPLDMV